MDDFGYPRFQWSKFVNDGQYVVRANSVAELSSGIAALEIELGKSVIGQAQQETQVVPAQQRTGGTKFCTTHNVTMHERTNDQGSWFSHKTTDGKWCRG